MIIFVKVKLKKIFKKKRNYSWSRPKSCPRCNDYKVWGHGYAQAIFDGYNEPLLLKLYRCPVCGCVIRLRPLGYFKRFQAKIRTIRSCISHKEKHMKWLSGKGSNIVTNDLEYISNVIAWLGQRENGVEIRFAKNREGELLPEDIEKELDERTAVLSISQVTWGNGFRHDIKTLSKIAHENGAYLVVDGIQCVGAMKIDVKKEGIDFLVCGTHKWLLGPGGAAFLYMREDIAKNLAPLFTFMHALDKKFIERNVFDGFCSYNMEYGSISQKHDMVTFNP